MVIEYWGLTVLSCDIVVTIEPVDTYYNLKFYVVVYKLA